MPPSQDASNFTQELSTKLDEVIQWAVENSPVTEITLSPQDFTKIREKFLRTATGENRHTEPEPEEGGAQYINDNPAPWP